MSPTTKGNKDNKEDTMRNPLLEEIKNRSKSLEMFYDQDWLRCVLTAKSFRRIKLVYNASLYTTISETFYRFLYYLKAAGLENVTSLLEIGPSGLYTIATILRIHYRAYEGDNGALLGIDQNWDLTRQFATDMGVSFDLTDYYHGVEGRNLEVDTPLPQRYSIALVENVLHHQGNNAQAHDLLLCLRRNVDMGVIVSDWFSDPAFPERYNLDPDGTGYFPDINAWREIFASSIDQIKPLVIKPVMESQYILRLFNLDPAVTPWAFLNKSHRDRNENQGPNQFWFFLPPERPLAGRKKSKK